MSVRHSHARGFNERTRLATDASRRVPFETTKGKDEGKDEGQGDGDGDGEG